MDSNFSLDSLLNVSAVPQDDRVAAFIAESKNNRSRCYEMSEQMTAAVATDGQSFKQYLDVQSRFDRYTANNALLIRLLRKYPSHGRTKKILSRILFLLGLYIKGIFQISG